MQDAVRQISDMNQKELQEVISVAVDSVLSSRSSIDAETHRAHHEFIARQKERYELCRTNRQKIINGIITAIGIMAVSAIGVWMWDKFKSDFKEPVKIERPR